MSKPCNYKYMVRVYDKRTQKTRAYRGPYRTKAQALQSAKNAELYYSKNKNIGISIRD